MFIPSIITSFVANGFLDPDLEHEDDIQYYFEKIRAIFSEHFPDHQHANNSALPIELYIFMEPDFKYLKKKFAPSENLNLSNFLSKLTKGSDLLERTFELLANRFQDLNVTPVAIASFFPEISHTAENRYSPALKAIEGMQQLAQRFNQENNWDIRAIELVCGSRIKGLALEHDDKEKKRILTSQLIPEEDIVSTLNNFINRLQGTVENCNPQDVVPYALELEPGSLFLANSAQSLTHIAELLKNSKHIGFNLDLSHYCLADILKQDDNNGGSFQLSSEIANSNAFEIFRTRIVHAHISDSSDKGHLGDLPFESIHNRDYFIQQIRFLSNLITNQPPNIPFSNYLSMELEAVSSWHEIKRSFETLCSLCKSV